MLHSHTDGSRLLLVSLLLMGGLSFSGCASSSETQYEPYAGTRVLPSTRTILSPDSLVDIRLVNRSDSVHVSLKKDFSTITQKWSTQLQRSSYDQLLRPSEYNSYATLRSLEYSLASLQRTQRINSLSTERARKGLDDVLSTYAETVSFDVHLYVNATQVGGPYALLRQSVGAELIINGDRQYASVESEKGDVAVLRKGGETVFHYPITVSFPRTDGDQDILAHATRVELSLRPFHQTGTVDFRWKL